MLVTFSRGAFCILCILCISGYLCAERLDGPLLPASILYHLTPNITPATARASICFTDKRACPRVWHVYSSCWLPLFFFFSPTPLYLLLFPFSFSLFWLNINLPRSRPQSKIAHNFFTLNLTIVPFRFLISFFSWYTVFYQCRYLSEKSFSKCTNLNCRA